LLLVRSGAVAPLQIFCFEKRLIRHTIQVMLGPDLVLSEGKAVYLHGEKRVDPFDDEQEMVV